MNQKLALRLLSQMSYSAEVAGDGQQAIDALERDDFDVVLMDVQMPELDGLEATRRIRARWPDRPLQIVAMTANAMAGDREACLAAGMDDYISKPIRPAELAAALERVQPTAGAADGRSVPQAHDQGEAEGEGGVTCQSLTCPSSTRACSTSCMASTGDDVGFVRELVETYLADTPDQLEAMDGRRRGR